MTAESRYRVAQTTTANRVAAVVGMILLVFLASLPAWGDSGTMRLLIEFFTLLALAQMWNLLAGYAGLVSIGQQAFIGLGAYGLYVFADLVHLHPLLAIALTAAGVGVIALITSFFVFRLEGGYFAVGTWVIAEVIRLIVASNRSVGAGTGVSIQSLAQFGPQGRIALTYWLALAVGFGAVAIGVVLMRSRLGLSLRAIRDSDVAARSLGVDVFRAKVAVYLVAAVGCAVAGSVIYMNLLRIQPTAAFSVEWSARIIFIVVIGGVGSIEGPIIGTVAFIALRELLGDFGSAYLILLGAIAMAAVLFAPRGLWGLFTARWSITFFGVQRRLIAGASPPTGPPPTPGPTESRP
jgi:branched-chain amino acid transport system permease protein